MSKSSSKTKPTIGITMGDPAGIGPEVVIKALADPEVRKLAHFVVFGMNELLSYAADLAEIDPYWWRVQHDSPRVREAGHHNVVVLDYDEYSFLGLEVHRPTRQGGQLSLAFLDDAIAAAQLRKGAPGKLDALVTAPICKESWKMAGCNFPGHTEFLQHRTRSKRSVMMFHSSHFMLTLATIHVGLMNIREMFTIGCVFDAIDLGLDALRKMGVKKPRIAVCGLNPHAGEHGMFGDEEERIIIPAMEMAIANAGDAIIRGPLPADTLFVDAARGKYDLVVAMYHDQGLIPLKMLAFDEAVNTTLGLPVIRTSVDHGTAFDIVGQNKANPGSMKAAIKLAAQLATGADGNDKKK